LRISPTSAVSMKNCMDSSRGVSGRDSYSEPP
jgi:hypothetical protein